MESLCSRVAGKRKHVIVVANGGLFSAAELRQLIKRPVILVLLRDSGRLASILSLLAPSLHTIPLGSVAEFSTYMHENIGRLAPKEMAKEFLEKDFGLDPYEESGERRKLYRELLMSIIACLIDNKIVVHTPSVAEFEHVLSSILL